LFRKFFAKDDLEIRAQWAVLCLEGGIMQIKNKSSRGESFSCDPSSNHKKVQRTLSVLLSGFLLATSAIQGPAHATPEELRIVLSDTVALLIPSNVPCDPVKPGAYYACEITAKAEAPWFGGGEHRVFDDTGVRRGFLSVFSDPLGNGLVKARISLESIPPSLTIRIADNPSLITISPPEILPVRKFSFDGYSWPKSVKSSQSVRVYSTLLGRPSSSYSLLAGIPRTLEVEGNSECSRVAIPIALLDKNEEALLPRSSSTSGYLQLRVSAWQANQRVANVEFGQRQIPWSNSEITEIPLTLCGISKGLNSQTNYEIEVWAAFNLLGREGLFERSSITVKRVAKVTSNTEATQCDASKSTFRTWTKRISDRELKFYAREIVGAGKVSFRLNDKEVAWVRATNNLDSKLNLAGDGMVRTAQLSSGRNVLEIHVGSCRSTRTIYSR